MPRNALVTGATGFIGSNLARRLAADGWKVHAVVRKGSERGILKGAKVKFHEFDGKTASMLAIVEAARPDVAFHIASLFLAAHAPGDVSDLVRSNVEFGAQLLEGLRAAGVRNLVNTGTAWQHFENNDYSPVNLYAATKQAFEAVLRYYVEAHDLRAVTLKIYDSYGPGDPRKKLFWALREAAAGKLELKMSPGDQLIDLVHVDDIVAAFLAAAERLLDDKVQEHRVYAVTTGKPRKLKDVVALYEKVTGTDVNAVWGGREYRAREVMVPWNRGEILPGWTPKIALEEGLKTLR